jgi:L-ascorbate metabolism protein UlaG (beta-lactamase superfamily)
MEITSLGHAGFRLKGKETTIVIDPPSPEFGGSLKGVTADIVCVTHSHPGHSYVRGIGGTPRLITGPGEYEIGGALITGLRTFHDDQHGAVRGANTIYLIHLDDLVVCHLGDLGHTLSAAYQQEANGADILMIPVGGHSTIDAATAVEVIGEIEPGIIIPMHYSAPWLKVPTGGVPLDPVSAFCQAMGVAESAPVPKLVVTRATMPAETQVVILSPRG